MEIIAIGVVAVYNLAVIFLYINWKNIKPIKKTTQNNFYYSVVVAVKNEAENIEVLINSLLLQSYNKDKFEIIFVNDHSVDSTIEILRSYISKQNNITLLDNIGFGKKAAIKTGIDCAKGEVIICTDGDCEVGKDWLKSYANIFDFTKAKLVFGPMAFKKLDGLPNKSLANLWYDFQQIEYASLIGSGAASWQARIPNMCNGGNIGYLKSAFAEVQGFEGNESLATGDDEFLMHKVFAKYPKDVYFNKIKQSIVHTNYCKTLGEFYHQRLRWASKWEHYTDWKVKAVAFFVFLANCCTCYGIIKILFECTKFGFASINPFLTLILTINILRWIIEYIFLADVIKFLDKKINVLSFAMLVFVYPFYVLFFGIAARFSHIKQAK